MEQSKSPTRRQRWEEWKLVKQLHGNIALPGDNGRQRLVPVEDLTLDELESVIERASQEIQRLLSIKKGLEELNGVLQPLATCSASSVWQLLALEPQPATAMTA